MQRTEPFFYRFRSHAKFLAKGPEVVTDQVTRTRTARRAGVPVRPRWENERMMRPRHDLLCPLEGECICDLLARARSETVEKMRSAVLGLSEVSRDAVLTVLKQ